MSGAGNLAAILGSRATDDRLADGAWSFHGSVPVRILLVDDDEDDALLLKATLEQIPEGRFDLAWVKSAAEALEALATGWYDATFIDYNLGESSGVELIREAIAAGCVTPLIMLTGQHDRTTDMVAMKAGAADFLVKGQTNATLLDRTLRYAITSARIREELRRGREQILGLEQVGRLLAEDWPIDDAIEQLLRVMGDAFEYEHVAVYLRAAKTFELRRARGYGHPVVSIDASDTKLERAVTGHQPVLVANFTRSPQHRESEANVRSELCLPIVIEGRTIGLFAVGSPDGAELGERDLTILRAIANRLAAALALSLERELVAARGRRSRRLSAVIRDLGAVAAVGDDAGFWTTLAMSAGEALKSGVVVLALTPDGPDESTWRQLAQSGLEPSGDVGALAVTALTEGRALDGSRNLSAVRLDGWCDPVVLINVGGVQDAPGEILVQLATATEPILRLRMALHGQARLSAFCLAVDWAIARREAEGRSAACAVLLIESLDVAISSAQLASDLAADPQILVAALSPELVGVILEVEPDGRPAAAAMDLAATVARTRSVLGGVSVIGPDLVAAALERASGALELARRLGPGNTVAA
jgi:CheY-like chemotaxis protein